jgi:hypothetical protein
MPSAGCMARPVGGFDTLRRGLSTPITHQAIRPVISFRVTMPDGRPRLRAEARPT